LSLLLVIQRLHFLQTNENRLFGLQNWNETYCTLISSARYVGLAGSGLEEVEAEPKFSVTSVGVIFNQWGVKPSQSPRQIERWVDIPSATTEIRRGIKKKKKETTRQKYNVRICYAGRP